MVETITGQGTEGTRHVPVSSVLQESFGIPVQEGDATKRNAGTKRATRAKACQELGTANISIFIIYYLTFYAFINPRKSTN